MRPRCCHWRPWPGSDAVITLRDEVDRRAPVPAAVSGGSAQRSGPVEQLHGAVRFSTVAADSKIRRLVRNVVRAGDSGVITVAKIRR